jgi:hypothetical protein
MRFRDRVMRFRDKGSIVKAIGREHWVTEEMGKLVKELDSLDKTSEEYRRKGEYEAYLKHMRHRLQIILRIERYAMARIVGLEYEYKDVTGMLDKAQADYDGKVMTLDEQERALAGLATSETQKSTIYQRFGTIRKDMDEFRLRIQHLRTAVQAIRTNLREHLRSSQEKFKHVQKFS